jgi:uncharacterized protein YndB with AHSA1/START domain
MNRIEITVSRLIPAAPADVYDVWLDPKSPGGPWFGCDRVVLDAKVGGLFHHAVKHEGREWAHYGRFVELERPRLIEHTWMSEATRGLDSRVRITLEPKENGTLFSLLHSGLPDDALGRQHQEGWTYVASAIASRFGGSRSA